MGLGVVASESISDGDTIATDRPICFVLSPSSNDRRCHGCLASSSELYPCICGWTHACEACRSIQHTFHTSDECRIFQSEEFDELTSDVQEYIRLGLRVWNTPNGCLEVRTALSRAARKEDWRQWDAIHEATLFATMMNSEIDRDLFLDCLLRLTCNSIGIIDDIWNDVATFVCTKILHLFNHSCDPSACFDYWSLLEYCEDENHTYPVLVLRAIQTISVGEQIFIPYARCRDHTDSRQRFLLETIGFLCTCSRCTSDTSKRRQRHTSTKHQSPLLSYKRAQSRKNKLSSALPPSLLPQSSTCETKATFNSRLCPLDGCSFTYAMPFSVKSIQERKCVLCGQILTSHVQ
eukprot:gene92-3485_t